jgi:predicted transcriptional regulator
MIICMLARITVSMPSALLKDTDRLAKQLGVGSRSALIVEALRTLVARSLSQDVDASLDAYYGSRSRGEVAEERAMVRAFSRSRKGLDLDREGRG